MHVTRRGSQILIDVAVLEPAGRLYGSEYSLLDLIDGLPRDDFRWRVYLPPNNGFDRLLEDRRVPIDPVYPRDLASAGRVGRASLYAKILFRLWRHRPDVLYVNQTGSMRSAALYAKRLGLPMVVQVQTLEDARWISEREALHRDVMAFICNSDFIAGQTRVDPQRKCVAYYGIPADRVDAAVTHHHTRAQASPKRVESDTIRFALLGRIAESKGHYLLLDALERLRDDAFPLKIKIIGEGLTKQETRRFEASVAKRGFEDVFEFRGYQSDIAAELSDVDLLLIPSIAEPLGRVLYDAAELGVPVIASDAGGLGEVCQRFDIGVQFASQNAEALAAAMKHASKDLVAVTDQFQRQALEMMRRLNSANYFEHMAEMLRRTAERKPTSFEWFGSDAVDKRNVHG